MSFQQQVHTGRFDGVVTDSRGKLWRIETELDRDDDCETAFWFATPTDGGKRILLQGGSYGPLTDAEIIAQLDALADGGTIHSIYNRAARPIGEIVDGVLAGAGQ
jgi:hypothetical protein